MNREEFQVQVEGLWKRFGHRVVLRNVTFRVARGETVAIIGPSGAGKSTLLRCLNGLCPFDAGIVRVGPHVLRPGKRPAPFATLRLVRQRLGMIFQDFQLFPHLTALENIIEAPIHVNRISRKEAEKRALALLTRVGMGDRGDAYPRELSGGQKQRVAIARALAMEPFGLLCDEITSALDPELKAEVLAVLEDLRREGMTLILVTHELAFAQRVADRVIVLADGEIIEDGPPHQVFAAPEHPRTSRFLEQVAL
ncbi:amino acid ABC transporter ATP-binding protein [Thermogutta sp.]|uniref:amino acid ABC transporter ATP-binding protein n=1 Tax=Thermogutta sp. TaxID=1962930 RepID=UPI0032203C14